MHAVGKQAEREFIPVNIAVMTVSDSRSEADDTSGRTLVERLGDAGHRLAEKLIVPDDIYRLREAASRWIADPDINVIITTGGTGMTGRDSTPEAIRPLLDKELEGIGELFRWLSYRDIKTSTVASRALGGVANGTFIFCLPGSTGACRTGWDEIIAPQLDYRNGPCNMVELMPRLREQ
jgi:molybdenum cofactor biosynthesis protein B